ncbi:MAG: hypothetical protein M3Q79_02805 [bacterium]|nr:hypothetical protein [bacterium]
MSSLVHADIFTVMGSVCAEVARYDSALSNSRADQAKQAVSRAEEIMNFSQKLAQLNSAQKLEINKFRDYFLYKVKNSEKSGSEKYLLPFATAARLRQL